MLLIGSIIGHQPEPPRCRRAADGWDECTETIVSASQTAIGKGSVRSPAGIGGTFFVMETQPVGFKGCYPILEIRSRGIQSYAGYIAECTGYGGVVSGDFENIPGAPAGVKPGNILLNRVGVTIRSLSTNAPSCSDVATAQTPPVTFGLPANPFTWLANPAYNYPSGWVLDKRDGVQLCPGASYYGLVDYYSYYWIAVPNTGG